MNMSFEHKPVLLEECIDSLAIVPDGIYIDGTAGGAGHSAAIAEKLTTGRLVAIDRDPSAVEAAAQRLGGFGPVATVVRSNYSAIPEVLESLGIKGVNGILLDLGVSSHQLDEAQRGFSYHQDAPLDMRMEQSGMSAYDVVNNYDERELSRIFREYGEEKFAPRIARAINTARTRKQISTTGELVEIIKAGIPAAARREGGHPAKRVFQAVRIEVNAEFAHLKDCLFAAFETLLPGGRFVVITFHSLEDRIVKQSFQKLCEGCVCPPQFPVCVCGKKPGARLVNKKPITAKVCEIAENNRSRSAKLRVLEKI
jgi:16S rRNA (cytosine1402-N4)-methyltransferase